MNTIIRNTTLAALALLAMAFLAQPAAAQSAEEIMKTSHLNHYYSGDDGVSHVMMSIVNKKGKTREREFVMLRKDFVEGGEQRYFAYFKQPNDVRRTTFMAWKNPDADDSRWIYVPALDLVKPLSANDKKSSFVGSDFSYEDVSGRHWSEDNHTLVKEEELNGTLCYVIESVPKEDDYFARRISWIGKENMLPMKEEFQDDKGKVLKVYESLEFAEIDGILTATKRRMTTPRKENHTLIEFTDIAYNQGLGEDLFSERYLKSPPREYID